MYRNLLSLIKLFSPIILVVTSCVIDVEEPFEESLFIDQFEDIIAYSSECDEDSKLTISDNTNVILCAQNYDYGLPGRGLIIWHINESYIDNLNDDIDNRTVKIIEADGAQDIGYQNYMYPIADPSAGWKWDLWFPDNDAYFFVNSDEDYLNFNSHTNPSSLSDEGARTYIRIYDIRYVDDSSSMEFRILPEQDIFISELISDSTNFEVIGAGIFDDSGYIIIDNTDEEYIQAIESSGIKVKLSNILMNNNNDKTRLAEEAIEFLNELS